MKKADIQEIEEKILSGVDNVFLYLGGHHFPQEHLNDAESYAKKLDKFVSSFWVWQDTEFDNPDVPLGQEHYRQGPLLLQINNIGKDQKSPLLDHFMNVWAYEQKGLVLTSAYSADELDLYLKSLLWMQGEDNEIDKYAVNLQNPDFQNAWLQSFSEQKLQAFMGPISSITWLDISGYEMQWYTQINKQPELTLQSVGWYLFDNEQIALFEKKEQEFLHQELTSHALYENANLKASQASDMAQETIQQARQKGIIDYKSTLLALKAQLLIKEKEDVESIINVLANPNMPLDVRIQLAEQEIDQAQQATAV